jgi:prophage regulatory protein
MAKLIDINTAVLKPGWKKSHFHAQIKLGLMTPPVKLGRRCARYVESEVDAVVNARIAGKSDDEVKQLIVGLVAARSQQGGA